MTDDILVHRDGAVAVVTLNRPERMNAVHLSVLVELADRLAELDGDDEVGAVVLTGAGRSFCAGGDVKLMGERAPRSFEGRVADSKRMNRAPLTIRSMPKVVIAAINGPAMGAGLSLALACDIRIASQGAKFSTAFRRIALSGDLGGTYTLPRLVGPSLARELYFTGRTIDAAEALSIGLIGRVVDDDQALSEALSLAREIAAGPRVAVGLMKRNLLAAETESFAGLLDIEAFHQARASSSEDHAEAKRAFAERRAPAFSGR